MPGEAYPAASAIGVETLPAPVAESGAGVQTFHQPGGVAAFPGCGRYPYVGG